MSSFKLKLLLPLISLGLLFVAPSVLAADTQLGGNLNATNYGIYSLSGLGIGTSTITAGQICFASGCQSVPYAGGTQQTSAAYVTSGIFGSSVTSSNSYYYIQPYSNLTSTFKVMDSSGNPVFNVDTTNDRVGIGTSAPTVALSVVGDVQSQNMIRATGWASGGEAGQGAEIGVTGGNSYLLSYNRTSSAYAPLILGASTISLDFSGSSNPALFINTSGNVGIGTTTPATKLYVSGNATIGGGTNPGNTLSIATPSGGAYLDIHTGTWGTDASAYFYVDNTNGVRIGSLSSNNVSLMTSNQARVTILSTGNVGIGTTAPSQKLTVAGTIYSTSGGIMFPDGSVQTTAFAGGTQQTSAAYVTSGIFGSSVTSSNSYYYIQPYSNLTSTFKVMDSSGNPVFNVDTTNDRVGIGTASPGATLDVNGETRIESASNGMVRFQDTNNYGAGYSGLNGVVFDVKNKALSAQIPLVMLASQYTLNGGNVGIGTSSPSKTLQVMGPIGLNDGSWFGGGNQSGYTSFYTSNNGAQGIQAGALYISGSYSGAAPTNGAYIQGNVGIGTPSPAAKLEVNGTAQVDSALYIASTSTALAQGSGSSLQITTPSGYVQIGSQNGAWAHFQTDRPAFYFNQGLTSAGTGYSLNAYSGINLVLATNGTARLTIASSTGYVGVGTASPAYLLDVNGTERATAITVIPGSMTDPGTNTWIYQDTNGNWTTHIISTSLSLDTGSNSARSSRLFVSSAGSIGIGTTTPSYALDVESGAVYVGGAYGVGAYSFTARRSGGNGYTYPDIYGVSGGVVISGLVSGGGTVAINTSGGSTPTAYFTGNYVGIGTASPGVALDVNAGAASNAQVRISSSGNDAALAFNNTGTGGRQYWIDSGSGSAGVGQGNLAIWDATAGAARLVVASSGYVGIGTTAPTQTLQVNGNAQLIPAAGWSGSNTAYLYLGDTNSGISNTFGSTTNLFTYWGVNFNNTHYSQTMAALTQSASGQGNVTFTVGAGAGKITAATIDPVYTIGGEKYATYGPEMTGVNVETTGVVQLTNNSQLITNNSSGDKLSVISYKLNIADAPVGSNLWLWSQTTNLKNVGLGNVSILLTPSFDGKVWYTKDSKDMTVTIYAQPSSVIPSGAKDLEVSYRLSAPRFDAAEWPNTSDASVTGINLDQLIK